VFSPAIIAKHVYENTAGLLAGAASKGVKRFVYCSSMARYGSGNPPFTEEQRADPEDPYGIAKYAGELLVANVADTHGMEYAIAVPHNIIGPRQKYDDPYRNVASIMINRMLQGKQPIIYGDGEQVRCFSFVQDCVDPLVKMGTRPELVSETINIGPDEEAVTINELASILARLVQFDLDPIRVAARPKEVRDARCCADKARRLLGYKTQVSLEDGLRSMIDWIRAHGTKPFEYHLPIEIDSPLVPATWRDRLL
jgi:UDP-glucose 4-epimerase